jgi:uncharacterized membrane protein
MNWFMLLLVFIAVLIGSVGALLLKKGSAHFHVKFHWEFITKLLHNYILIWGIFMYGLSAIFFIYALKLGELSVVYPLTSMSYVIISLLSIKYLNEKMNAYKWAGIAFIILGVVLVKM